MTDYAKRTVAELTEILKSKGLPHTGKKADVSQHQHALLNRPSLTHRFLQLVARLTEADKAAENHIRPRTHRRIRPRTSSRSPTSFGHLNCSPHRASPVRPSNCNPPNRQHSPRRRAHPRHSPRGRDLQARPPHQQRRRRAEEAPSARRSLRHRVRRAQRRRHRDQGHGSTASAGAGEALRHGADGDGQAR